MRRFAWVLAVAGPLAIAQASAAPLDQGLSYVQPLSTAAARDVQDRLRQLGAYDGPADGVWGRGSRLALERFQRTHGLQPTGQLNQATVATLGLNWAELLAAGQPAAAPPPPPAQPTAALSADVVRNIQSRLRGLGFYPGPIDGIWGPEMQTAIERFQQGRGLQPNGQLTPATITAMGLDPNNLSAPPH